MHFNAIFSLIMLGTLAACGGGGNSSSPTVQSTPTSQKQPTQPTQPKRVSQPVSDSQRVAAQTLPIQGFTVKPAAAALQAELQKAIQYTNQLRAEKGLPALKYDAKLAAYAQQRAEEVVGRFAHTRPDGNESFHDKVLKQGRMGENLAAGANSAQQTVMEQWKNSSGHYANIVRPEFSKIGMGLVYVSGSQYGYHWVQIFGSDNIEIADYAFDNSAAAKQNRLSDVSAHITTARPSEASQYLWVDNTQIYLNDFPSNGAWREFNKNGYHAEVNGYQDTRFGVVKKGSENQKVFYFGKHTEYDNMPQTGSARYTGKGVIVDKQSTNKNVDAQFTADFGNKKLNGTLSERGQKAVDIKANIRGTSFQSPSNAAVETQGAFFGERAKELGGVFYEHSTGKYGAFGAKQ